MILRNSTSWLAIAGAITVLATPAVAQQAVPVDQQATGADSVAGDTADIAATASAQRRGAITGEQADDGNDGMIVVTGTRINRPNVTAAAPITSVTIQDIRAQAPLNVEEVLNRLPQVAPDSQQNYQDSDGRQRIKLRSLGFERTLVLVDGKRLGTQNGQDTNMIPVTLLERIDILTGGASSVYGSDAVAGVVNFVMKQNFTGVRLDANYNFYNHVNKSTLVTPVSRASGFTPRLGSVNDGGRADVSLTAGTSLFDGAVNVSGFVNYKHTDLVPYASRSSSSCQLLQTVKDGPLSCSLSTYSTSGYIAPQSGANNGTAFVNDPAGTRSFVPYGNGIGAGKAANPFDGYSFQRQGERVNAGGFVTIKLAPEAEIYGSALWFRDKSTNRFPMRAFSFTAYGSTPYQVNCNNPFLSASQRTTLCGAAAGTSALVPLEVRYRFNAPFMIDTYTNSAIRATGGIRGKVGDAWTYDVGGVFARNQQIFDSSRLPDFDRVNRSLNVVSVNGTPTCSSATNGTDASCVPFDAFSAGNNNQTLIDYIYGGLDPARQKTVGLLYNVIAGMTGDLGKYGVTSPLANDGVAFALGTEFRKDRQFSTSTAGFREDYGGTDSDRSQHVWESNIEVQVPLVQERPFAHLLQANGGYRLSKYSSNPDKFTTWKLEGLYAPVRDLTFRASFNKAQRAPTVVEAFQASNISFGRQGGSQNDFCAPVTRQIQNPNNPNGTITTTAPLASREICRATGLSDALYGSTTLLCPNDQCTVRSGGFTADPETAYTQTYGLVVKPSFVRGLVFSVDRYRIKINNSLGYNDDSYYTDGCLRSNGDPFFCSGIVRAANGTLYAAAGGNPTSGFIRAGTTNYYFSIARGWDFQTSYALGLGSAGRVDLDFNGSLTTFAGGQDSPLQPKRNCAGYFGNGCGQLLPKWAHGLRTTYTTPDSVFNASFNWRYVSSLTNANNSGDEAIGGTPERAQTTFTRIAPVSYFDLALTFNIARQFAFRIIANNLLDKQPPILANSYNISLARNNTIPARYDSLGRQIAIGTTISF
ncbi:TonB-dependent receptor [Sphingomonas sp. Leaf339]|uniref:TonB-dependent receptor plug domain-containing protein n=1 Tax=Sphingomonas sp. Leaf339 TaxID=1736343 RepID=UPI0007015BE4|nr:TonB-dependent receptor plug domain-containing protein [Sphingomonas sp. Leaf339]KQU45188.1 TonB-dependent receptor [Sphingomonas sp. Leaf339]